MPLFVRAGLRYNRWLETEGREPLDFPADVLTDLKTTGDQLSVFEVTAAVNAERIAIAVAAGRQDPDDTSYAVFDRVAAETLGIVVSQDNPGGTNDKEVNALHRDLQVGTARRLLEFAGLLASGEIVPLLKGEVTRLLKDGFESGRLDHTRNKRLCDKVKAQISKRQPEGREEA